MMSPLAMFLTSGELVTTYDRKGSGDRLEGQLNMADSYAVSHLLKTDLGLKNTYLVHHQFGTQYL